MRPPQCSSMAKPLGLLHFATSRKSLLIPSAFVVMILIVMNSSSINSDVINDSKRSPMKFEQRKLHLNGVGVIKELSVRILLKKKKTTPPEKKAKHSSFLMPECIRL